MHAVKREVAISALVALVFSGFTNIARADFKVEVNLLPQNVAVKKNDVPENPVDIEPVVNVSASEKNEKVAVVESTPKIQQVWTLTVGRTVGQELQAWGEKAGWKIIWSMSKDWAVPASTSFSGEFQGAASDVIKTLAANGALVRAQFYEGNKTLVITGPGVTAQ